MKTLVLFNMMQSFEIIYIVMKYNISKRWNPTHYVLHATKYQSKNCRNRIFQNNSYTLYLQNICSMVKAGNNATYNSKNMFTFPEIPVVFLKITFFLIPKASFCWKVFYFCTMRAKIFLHISFSFETNSSCDVKCLILYN